MAKKSYAAKVAITHDGEPYAAGDEIALEDKHAKPLIDVGAIEEIAIKTTKKSGADPEGGK